MITLLAAQGKVAPVDVETVRTGVKSVVGGQDLPLGRIRITYTAGPAPLGSGRGDGSPTSVPRPSKH